jgi:hypothetical protein
MKRYEKAIIVRYDIFGGASNHDKASDAALGELNSLIADGWSVKHTYGMVGTQMQVACGLVVLTRQ